MATKPLLLLVDDEKDFRDIFSMKLESAGFNVVTAVDGRDALNQLKIKKIKPDLVLLDMRMPEMNGAETMYAIKSDPELKNLKVAFLTNLGETIPDEMWSDEKFAREVGAIDYIRKSDDLDKIVEQVKKLISV